MMLYTENGADQTDHFANVFVHKTLSAAIFLYLILYVPSTIFQLNRDGSPWVEPVLS